METGRACAAHLATPGGSSTTIMFFSPTSVHALLGAPLALSRPFRARPFHTFLGALGSFFLRAFFSGLPPPPLPTGASSGSFLTFFFGLGVGFDGPGPSSLRPRLPLFTTGAMGMSCGPQDNIRALTGVKPASVQTVPTPSARL